MLRNKRVVIAFYGIDGSGKTTLAKLLANLFKAKRMNVYVIRLRAHHTFMYVLIRLVLLVKGYDYNLLRGKPLHLNYIVKKYFGDKILYVTLEIVSVLIWFIIEFFPQKILQRSDTVFIADRFVPDFIVMLRYTSYLNEQTLLKLAKVLEKFMYINPVYFHIYVDPHKAIIRKKEEKLHPLFVIYLSAKYQWISKYLEHVTIDTTNKKPLELMTQVLDYLDYRKEARCI
jgi:thymidylate kinase